jgi:hypothetical protein
MCTTLMCTTLVYNTYVYNAYRVTHTGASTRQLFFGSHAHTHAHTCPTLTFLLPHYAHWGIHQAALFLLTRMLTPD